MPSEYYVDAYLTRRNLLTLLNKLDRAKREPGSTKCQIVKRDTKNPKYPQSHMFITVTAVEDEDYYEDRNPGKVHPEDDPR